MISTSNSSIDQYKERISRLKYLSQLTPGAKGKIIKISGDDKTAKRLIEIGFVPGKDIKVLYSSPGSMIVYIMDTKIAIGKSVADRILVEVYKS